MAVSSRKTLEDRFFFPIGIISLILSTSGLSNFLSLSVTTAGLYACSLFGFILVFRCIRSHEFRDALKNLLLRDVGVITTVYLLLSFIIQKLDFDYASQNFDAYYAIQDGEWLSTKSANSTSGFDWKNDSQELLPLGWSSSTIDRYGVSYLFAISKVFPQMDTWQGAQFLGLSLYLISFYTLYRLLNVVLVQTMSRRVIKAAVLLAFFSPFAIMQFQYFMFGQLLAIPVLYLLSYKLSQTKSVRFQPLLILIPVFFFIAYPAMFFVSVLAIGIYNLLLIRISNKTFTTFVRENFLLFGLTFLGIMLSSGSVISASFDRFLIWTITNADTSREVSWSTLKIFSQFSSTLFGPLIMGLIPYPFRAEPGIFLLATLCLISVFMFFSTVKFFSKVTDSNFNKYAVYSVHGTLFCLIIFAYIADKSYLVMKLTTWFYPLFMVIFLLMTWQFVISRRSLVKVRYSLTSVTFLITFSMIASTSVIYLERSTTWTNFPNIVKPSEYEAISALKSEIDNTLLISSPTIEESMWLAGRLGQNVGRNTFGLQEGGQALGVGMNDNCKLPKSLMNYDSKSLILFENYANDVTNGFKFTQAPRKVSDRFVVQSARYLKTAEVLIGSGTFPPINLRKDKIGLLEGNRFARWSSNQICIGFFSDTTRLKVIEFEYVQGPDLQLKSKWAAFDYLGNELQALEKANTVNVLFQPKVGWNLIQIVQPNCFLRKIPNRWSNRADDRSLCFLFGDIKFQDSPQPYSP